MRDYMHVYYKILYIYSLQRVRMKTGLLLKSVTRCSTAGYGKKAMLLKYFFLQFTVSKYIVIESILTRNLLLCKIFPILLRAWYIRKNKKPQKVKSTRQLDFSEDTTETFHLLIVKDLMVSHDMVKWWDIIIQKRSQTIFLNCKTWKYCDDGGCNFLPIIFECQMLRAIYFAIHNSCFQCSTTKLILTIQTNMNTENVGVYLTLKCDKLSIKC